YPSALLPRDAWAEKAGGDERRRAIEAAHQHRLKISARRVNFHMGSAPKAYRDPIADADRLDRDPHGIHADCANPCDPPDPALAAVWRNHRHYRAVLKQDWPLWVERGWLDLVVPMDYTPEPETFAATVDAQVSLTRGRVPLAAGIGNWLLQTPEELVRQVELA